MIIINPQFIDVDFHKAPEYCLGDLGRRARSPVRFGVFENLQASIPRTDWQRHAEEIEAAGGGLERLVTRIFNQGQEGSCVGNATSQGHMLVQAKQFGKDRVVHLSPISIYKRIGRSPGSGATIDDAYEEVNARGILPLNTPENRQRFGEHVMPATGFHTPFPRGWEATGKKFAGVELDVIRTMEGLVTSLLLQDPVIVGRQGHSICYVAIIFDQWGRMYALYVNSWGRWGQGAGDFEYGFGLDSESQIKASARWAFRLRSVTVPSDLSLSVAA